MRFRLWTRLLIPAITLGLGLFVPATGRAATPGHEQNLFEVMGVFANASNVILRYGYVTHYFGLPDSALFSSTTVHDETTAILTYASSIPLVSVFQTGDVASAANSGTLTIYYNPSPAGDFNNPTTFAQGTPVATYNSRFHITQTNLSSGFSVQDNGSLNQLTAVPFTVNGTHVVIGKKGNALRTTFQGGLNNSTLIALSGEFVQLKP